MKSMKDMLVQKEFNPICLWSQNNDEQPMNEEQLRVLNEIIRTNKIPEPYNFLIINSAMREGWDLKDESVELAIINTTDKTDQIQVRGRIRKNIKHLIIRTEDTDERYVAKVIVPNEYLNKELINEGKKELCAVLNKIDNRGRQSGWRAIRAIIEASGYIITDKKIRIDGKQAKVSIITLKTVEIEETVEDTDSIKNTKRTTTKKNVDKDVEKVKEIEVEEIEEIGKNTKKTKKTNTKYEDIAVIVHDKDDEISSINGKEVKLLDELEQERKIDEVNRELAKVGKSKIDKEMFNALKNVGLIK